MQVEGFFGKTKVSVAGGDVDLNRVKGLSLKWGRIVGRCAPVILGMRPR